MQNSIRNWEMVVEKLKMIPFDLRKKRLLFNCRKRGIVENELILSNYLQSHPITEQEIDEMEHFLMQPDWTLYKQMTSKGSSGLMGKLQKFTHEKRPLRMPELQ